MLATDFIVNLDCTGLDLSNKSLNLCRYVEYVVLLRTRLSMPHVASWRAKGGAVASTDPQFGP